MVRTLIIKGKEYYIITTTLVANGVEAPVQIHVNVSGLNKEQKFMIQRHSNFFFNRIFKSVTKPKPVVKKAWYKFW